MRTLEDLRREFRQWLQPGAGPHDCRVCRQRVQLYKRKLHQGMAIALVEFYRHDHQEPGTWMDYRKKLHRGATRDHGYLCFWDFIEPKPDEKGWYRITARGRWVVREDVRIPWACWVYNDEFHGWVENEKTGVVELTTIRGALGDAFDLDELLASLPGREVASG